HDGLAAVLQNDLGLDRHSGILVVFRPKRGDRIKVLTWDGTGLVLASKRLEDGRFAWPAIHDGVMRLSRAQFEALFEGLDWRRSRTSALGAPISVASAPGAPPRFSSVSRHRIGSQYAVRDVSADPGAGERSTTQASPKYPSQSTQVPVW
ncbi:MAG: IS66 family insertion sequence element accessory protein TnpB, partial [Pseudomonadota bacterium]